MRANIGERWFLGEGFCVVWHAGPSVVDLADMPRSLHCVCITATGYLCGALYLAEHGLRSAIVSGIQSWLASKHLVTEVRGRGRVYKQRERAITTALPQPQHKLKVRLA